MSYCLYRQMNTLIFSNLLVYFIITTIVIIIIIVITLIIIITIHIAKKLYKLELLLRRQHNYVVLELWSRVCAVCDDSVGCSLALEQFCHRLASHLVSCSDLCCSTVAG